MNKITKDQEGRYVLTTKDGKVFPCERWYEKKVDTWHIKLPAGNPTGRTYIRESLFVSRRNWDGIYEFEDKTNHRTGLSYGGWRSKMTPEEAKKVAECEKVIQEIKEIASSRVIKKVDPNSIEGLEAQIAKLMAKLEAKQG